MSEEDDRDIVKAQEDNEQVRSCDLKLFNIVHSCWWGWKSDRLVYVYKLLMVNPSYSRTIVLLVKKIEHIVKHEKQLS